MLLSRDQLVSAAGVLSFTDVPVPDLGDGATVRLRIMSGVEREQWDDGLRSRKDLRGITALLLRLTIADEQGNLMFGPDDEALIMSFPAVVLEVLRDKAFEMNKLGKKAAEDAEKN